MRHLRKRMGHRRALHGFQSDDEHRGSSHAPARLRRAARHRHHPPPPPRQHALLLPRRHGRRRAALQPPRRRRPPRHSPRPRPLPHTTRSRPRQRHPLRHHLHGLLHPGCRRAHRHRHPAPARQPRPQLHGHPQHALPAPRPRAVPAVHRPQRDGGVPGEGVPGHLEGEHAEQLRVRGALEGRDDRGAPEDELYRAVRGGEQRAGREPGRKERAAV
mmetsp:Transcript_18628/g.46730  ORF Transcript_18628/g.46730 Transcript_18628/m.46730 type:complete len:216 (-) Transcript_18628:492-1139(-)